MSVLKMAAIVAAILVCGVAIWIGGERLLGTPNTSNEILRQSAGQSDDQGDEAVLAQLRAKGADLTKVTDIRFYLYIPARRDAQTAASTLAKLGFKAAVEAPLGRLSDGSYEARFGVVANIDAVPSMGYLRRSRALFQGLARRYKGEYDGWEAAIAE